MLLNGSTEAIVSAAAFASRGHGSLAVLLILGIIGTMKFDIIYWWAGRLWGERVIQIFSGRGKRSQKFVARVNRSGRWLTWPAVVLSPFLPIPNALVYAAAGWTGMSWVTFLILDAIGSLAWAGLLAGLGWALGQSAVDVAQEISKYGLWVTIAIVVLVVASTNAGCKSTELDARQNERAFGLAAACAYAAGCVARQSPGWRWTLLGVAMSLTQLPTRTRVHAAAGEPRQVASRPEPAARRPRMMRMPADWWDSPTAVGCPLSRGPQSARDGPSPDQIHPARLGAGVPGRGRRGHRGRVRRERGHPRGRRGRGADRSAGSRPTVWGCGCCAATAR